MTKLDKIELVEMQAPLGDRILRTLDQKIPKDSPLVVSIDFPYDIESLAGASDEAVYDGSDWGEVGNSGKFIFKGVANDIFNVITYSENLSLTNDKTRLVFRFDSEELNCTYWIERFGPNERLKMHRGRYDKSRESLVRGGLIS